MQNILLRPLGRLLAVPGRAVAVRHMVLSEVEDQGRYILKVNVEPFKEREVTVKVDTGVVRVTGRRGESTGVGSWSQEMDVVYSLPFGVKRDSVTTKFEGGAVLVTADKST